MQILKLIRTSRQIPKMFKKSTLLLFSMFFLTQLQAQGQTDFLRSTGKIYSVVAVVVVIFIGLVIYLMRLDRKIEKLKNQINNE